MQCQGYFLKNCWGQDYVPSLLQFSEGNKFTSNKFKNLQAYKFTVLHIFYLKIYTWVVLRLIKQI